MFLSNHEKPKYRLKTKVEKFGNNEEKEDAKVDIKIIIIAIICNYDEKIDDYSFIVSQYKCCNDTHDDDKWIYNTTSYN